MNHDLEYDDYERGKVIVSLHKNFNYFGSPVSYIRQILDGIEIEGIELLYRDNKVNQESNRGDIVLVILKNKEKMAVIEAIEKLSDSIYVVSAEPDYLYDMYVIPNDPGFQYLWGMNRINTTFAWNYTRGNYNTVVGVLDSGVDYRHSDIRKNMWISPDRRYVNGWNFVENSNNSIDETGHGTHVAGTIGAVGNNDIGITGVCWHVQIASFKIGDRRIDLAAAIKAIYFASGYNIPILNNSWGGSTYSAILKYVIEQYNGLFIAAAGNNGTNNDFFPIYPASYDSDNIISVAATNLENRLASFSNYGAESVDIAAPGTNILSTTLDNAYSYKNGTSMAAPHVAGAAALLKSYMPYLSTSEIKNIILTSADRYFHLNSKILSGGILNVYEMFNIANSFYRIRKLEIE